MADVVYFTGHQFFDSDGNPLNGGLIRIYDAGTTDERTVYKDDGEATSWTQPITLNSAGRLTSAVYVPEGDWKFTRTNSAGGDSITEDNIPGAVAAASAAFAAPLRPILTKAANYTLTTSDLGKLIEADGTGGAFTLTLPSAADVATGKGYDIQQIGSVGAVTIATVSAQTINGASTFVLRPQYGTVSIVSDGANWYALPSETQYALPAAKTTAYVVKQADANKLIPCDATAAGFTVTLPTVALAGTGFTIGFKKTDSSANAVTIDGDGAETVDGATGITLTIQYDVVWLVCNGTTWHVDRYYNGKPLAQGQETIWLPKGSWTTRVTNGAASGSMESSTNDVMTEYWAFDATTSEGIQTGIQMPKGWNEGTIIAQFIWTHPATATNFGVTWGIRAVAFANDDALDTAFGTEQEVADTGGTTSDVYVSAETSAMTVAGTPGAEEYVVFEVYRDPADASDTLAVDAYLIGVKLHYTTNAPNDS